MKKSEAITNDLRAKVDAITEELLDGTHMSASFDEDTKEISIETNNGGLDEFWDFPRAHIKTPLKEILLSEIKNHRYMSKKHNRFGMARSGGDFLEAIITIVKDIEKEISETIGWDAEDFKDFK